MHSHTSDDEHDSLTRSQLLGYVIQALNALILVAGIPLASSFFGNLQATDSVILDKVEALQKSDHEHEIKLALIQAELDRD